MWDGGEKHTNLALLDLQPRNISKDLGIMC